MKIWLFIVAFNYGARFYESSVAESKNSTRSRREPGGRRRGSIKISSGEVWPNSMFLSSRLTMSRPSFSRAPSSSTYSFFFRSNSSPFSSELSDTIKRPKRNTPNDVTSQKVKPTRVVETSVPSFTKSAWFIPERIKRINNTDTVCDWDPFRF